MTNKIITKPPTPEYEEAWDRVFGKEKQRVCTGDFIGKYGPFNMFVDETLPNDVIEVWYP